MVGELLGDALMIVVALALGGGFALVWIALPLAPASPRPTPAPLSSEDVALAETLTLGVVEPVEPSARRRSAAASAAAAPSHQPPAQPRAMRAPGRQPLDVRRKALTDGVMRPQVMRLYTPEALRGVALN